MNSNGSYFAQYFYFSFRYVIVYFTILHIRHRAGIVTDEMLSMPKAPYVLAGLLEALGAATGMAAGGIMSHYCLMIFYFIVILPL